MLIALLSDRGGRDVQHAGRRLPPDHRLRARERPGHAHREEQEEAALHRPAGDHQERAEKGEIVITRTASPLTAPSNLSF